MNMRPAIHSDAAVLLEWRNDPATRAMSFEQTEIALPEHEQWFARKLGDPDCEIWIAEIDGERVGQVRFDLDDNAATVSIVIAPEHRGRGVGALVLDEALGRRRLGAQVVRAEVLLDNDASLRLFLGSGFAEVSRDDRSVLLERPDGDPGIRTRPAGT